MEERELHRLVDVLEEALDPHADADLLGPAAREVRDEARPLLEVDEADRDRQLVAGDRRVMQDGVAVDGAAARRRNGLPARRLAARAHRAGRVPELAAPGALLDQELPLVAGLPPPGVVVAARAADAARLRGRSAGCGRLCGGLVGPELEHAEGERAHLLPAL